MIDLPIVKSWTLDEEAMFTWAPLYQFRHVRILSRNSLEWLAYKGMYKFRPIKAYYKKGRIGEATHAMKTSIMYQLGPGERVVFTQALYKPITGADAELEAQLDGCPDPPATRKEGTDGWLCERPRTRESLDNDGLPFEHIFMLAWPGSKELWSMIEETRQETSIIENVSSIIDSMASKADRWSYI